MGSFTTNCCVTDIPYHLKFKIYFQILSQQSPVNTSSSVTLSNPLSTLGLAVKDTTQETRWLEPHLSCTVCF